MITKALLDVFLGSVAGQAAREGRRYAARGWVGVFSGSGESLSTLVEGRTGDYEVVLWSENRSLQHRCSCPSWRDPCKHEVAAALELRRLFDAKADGDTGSVHEPSVAYRAADGSPPARADVAGPDEARRRAIEEREDSARREKLVARVAEPPFFEIESPSGFAYRVQVRGERDGPHSCDCPDFEANRLHTCKHVERVRIYQRSPAWFRNEAHRDAASRPRVYLHFGEVLEPRLFGSPSGPGSRLLGSLFATDGTPNPPLARHLGQMRSWLDRLGRWVEREALDWLDERIEREPLLADGPLDQPTLPNGLRPYPYQWTGAQFLARRGRALLADEMGLGKTIQAILAALLLRRAERPAQRVTIVCPASLRGGWQIEIGRWTGERATLLEGSARERASQIAERRPWLITHFEQLWRDHARHAADPPDLLVIDEAQRAKGLFTRTARVLKAIASPYVFALTGTPLENRLEEAYAISQLIDQRLLPPLWQLDRDHFVRDEDGRRVVLYRNLGDLRSRLAPAFLRRRKEDVELELPERVRSISLVEMHDDVEETYLDVMGQVAKIARQKVIPPRDLERMQRLLVIARRCCNGPHMLGLEVDDEKVPKLAELEQILRDLCLGEQRKVVVFSEWTDMTERVVELCERLQLPAVQLRGSVPVKKRPALIRSFTDRAGPAVFVSTDAGGVGLNLQAASVVVNLDLPWNPARLEQRIARVHRIGSRSTVQVFLMVTHSSVEHRILELHETKMEILENVWAEDGEDIVAAPGGGVAFRQMVSSITEEQGEGPARAGEPRDDKKEGVAAEPTGKTAVVAAAPAAAEKRPAAGEEGEADAEAARPEPRTPRATESPAMDPESLARAVAAVAPTLPPEHRQSLATVFRALADALEGNAESPR